MAEAWIRGSATELDSAIAEAAKLLAESRMPVIAGLGTDVAGARAAIALARRIGGIVDHMHSAALLRDLDVMREAGMMVTTPNETRLRADPLLLVGPGLVQAWPELPERLLGDRKRRVIWLCPGDAIAEARAFPDIVIVGRDTAELPILLAALRARCAGRPVAKTPIAAHEIAQLPAGCYALLATSTGLWEGSDTDYIGNWLQILKSDDHAIFHAASQASKAAEFIRAFGAPPIPPDGPADEAA